MYFVVTLEELLDDNNLTIKSLSREIGLHCSVLYAYKNNDYLPSISTAVKIANYFDCSLNFLMGIDEEKEAYKFSKDFDLKVFYPRYSDLLEKENIKHFSLAKKIGLNVSSLSTWKQGKPPKMDTLIKIAQYFDVSIDYLIGRADK